MKTKCKIINTYFLLSEIVIRLNVKEGYYTIRNKAYLNSFIKLCLNFGLNTAIYQSALLIQDGSKTPL